MWADCVIHEKVKMETMSGDISTQLLPRLCFKGGGCGYTSLPDGKSPTKQSPTAGAKQLYHNTEDENSTTD
jgi:hypothetical protein